MLSNENLNLNKEIITSTNSEDYLLEIKNLKKYFPVKKGILKKTIGHVKATDDVSFGIRKGETLSLVGESGCGKSTTGRAILRLHEPTAGEILYNGKDIVQSSKAEMKSFRKDLQFIFQDPYSSLNGRMKVSDIVAEGMVTHKMYNSKAEYKEKVLEVINACGLSDYHASRYPHQFSGGQRQRIGIARALALDPKFIVADEPVSALDVSIQSQVINLMMDLQEERDLSYLFISHDLSVVKHISNRVGVMYLGSLVEIGSKDELFKNPAHPYTQALLKAIPRPDPSRSFDGEPISGDIPSNVKTPTGCKFHTRCPYAKAECKEVVPVMKNIGVDHHVACHIV